MSETQATPHAQNVVTSENLVEFNMKKLGIEPEQKEQVNEVENHEDAEETEEIHDEEQTDEVKDEKQEESKEEKPKDKKQGKFSKRLSELTAQRNAERERVAQLEARLKEIEEKSKPKEETKEVKSTDGKPNPADFTDAFDYAEKLAEWSAKQALAKREQEEKEKTAKQEQEKVVKTWQERIEKAKQDIEDFDDVVAASEVKVSDQVRDALIESEYGPQVLYYLANNEEIANKIANMTVMGALREIGKIEAKIEAKQGKKEEVKTSVSKAPAPITPIRGGKAGVQAVDGDGNVQVSFAEYKRLRQEGKIR